MLSVRLNGRILAVKFGGQSKVIYGFSTAQGSALLIPKLFKGELYIQWNIILPLKRMKSCHM